MRVNLLSCKGNYSLVVTSGVAKTFGETLKAHIEKQWPSMRAFDRAFHSGEGHVAHICRGANAPPDSATIARWSAALRLSDEATGELLRLGDIARAAHTPRRATGVATLQDRIERAENLALKLWVFLEAIEKDAKGSIGAFEEMRKDIDAIKQLRK